MRSGPSEGGRIPSAVDYQAQGSAVLPSSFARVLLVAALTTSGAALSSCGFQRIEAPDEEADRDGDGYDECNGNEVTGDDDDSAEAGDDDDSSAGEETPAEECDCDDDNPDTYPGAEEICDGEDNDCDGEPNADEVDRDGDGELDCADDGGDDDDDATPGDDDDFTPTGTACRYTLHANLDADGEPLGGLNLWVVSDNGATLSQISATPGEDTNGNGEIDPQEMTFEVEVGDGTRAVVGMLSPGGDAFAQLVATPNDANPVDCGATPAAWIVDSVDADVNLNTSSSVNNPFETAEAILEAVDADSDVVQEMNADGNTMTAPETGLSRAQLVEAIVLP